MKKYKKIISSAMALVITILPLSDRIIINPVTSYAEYITDGFHYTTNAYGWAYIESYDGTNPDVVIPKEIDGYYVKSITERLFADNQTIKTVDLSESEIVIGVGMFENSSVESVILPENMLYIPDNTFRNCKNLKNVEFNDNILVIPESAFEGSSYVIPNEMADKVKNACCQSSFSGYVIGDEWDYVVEKDYVNGSDICLKQYTGNDTDIVVPESIDNIPVAELKMNAFDNVVTSFVFPPQIKNFFSTPKLKYPEKLKSITFECDEFYFNGGFQQYSIEEITLPIPVDHTGKHILQNTIFKGSDTIRKVEFEKGEGELQIEEGAFENCSSLDTVIFHKGYDSVIFDRFCFRNSSIHRLELNSDCTIDAKTFSGCKNLQEVVFNGNVNISVGAFDDCPINNIIINDTSLNVFSGVFDGCISFVNINSEPAFDESTGDFNSKYKDFIIRNFSDADDVGFVNEYVTWHVKDIVNKYTNDSMTDMEKIKVLHDWVCDNVSYSTKTVLGAEEHNDLSPFLTGVTVCDGYARSLNLLLNEAGIETYYVCSDNHIWNVVKLGGHYFHVDTTWDDGESSYNWFLKSDNEIKAETSSHSYWELKTPSSLHSFQKDTLPECAYSMGDCNTDGNISIADAVKMNMYLMNTQSVSSDDIVLYDLDFNGEVDVFDMIEMRKMITGDKIYSDDINNLNNYILGKTDYVNPDWDFNGDGRIDVFDLILLRQQSAK